MSLQGLDSFIKKWSNLIYCPLDIHVPHFDVKTFLHWTTFARDTDKDLHRFTTKQANVEPLSENELEIKFNQSEFWKGYYARSYKTLNDQKLWEYDFDKYFPELCHLIDNLIPAKITTVGFLVQNKTDISPKNSIVHVDGREYLGFRIFINPKPRGLAFYKFKKDKVNFNTMSLNFTAEDWAKVRDFDETIIDKNCYYANYPNNPCIAVMTNSCAGHRVFIDEGINQETKITMLIMTNMKNNSYDLYKFNDLLEKSLSKYHDYAVWY